MMYDAIKNFNKQFEFEPRIENESRLPHFDKLVVVGMGGSHLAAGLLRRWKPSLYTKIHLDYGLPEISEEEKKNSLLVASSYSGNTEETLDAFEKALAENMPCLVISVGGKLLAMAQDRGLPYIQIPDTDIQPRSALGFSLKALMKLVGRKEDLNNLTELARDLNPMEYEAGGRELASRLRGFVPIIYSSALNVSLAYNWKIKFNEGAKIPAFFNVFPELNHNEMTGFDVKDSTRNLSRNFYFLILKDTEDHVRILKRMEVLERLYKDRGLKVESIELAGKNLFHKIFSNLIFADWTAYYTGISYGVETERVPMVEEFKKLI